MKQTNLSKEKLSIYRLLVWLGNLSLLAFATFLYTYESRNLPGAWHWDNLNNVLDAYCIQITGADQWGRPWPWNMRSFNDFRPPLLTYLVTLAGFFSPINLYVGRVVGMILGFFGVGFLVAYLAKGKQFEKSRNPLIFGFLFLFILTSPWVLVIHRMPHESAGVILCIIALISTTWALVCRKNSILLGVLNGLAAASLLYMYYGTKGLFFVHFPVLFVGLLLRADSLSSLLKYRGVLLSTILHMTVVYLVEFSFLKNQVSRIELGTATKILVLFISLGSAYFMCLKPKSILRGLLNTFVMCGISLVFFKARPIHMAHFIFMISLIINSLGGTKFLKAYRGVVASFLVAIFLALPTLNDLLGHRFSIQRIYAVGGATPTQVVQTFAQHIGPTFLFFEGDHNRRHHTGYKGALNQFFFIFYFIGFGALIFEIFKKRNLFWVYIFVIWVLDFLPVSFTIEGLPNSIRALAGLVPTILICYLGYVKFENCILKRKGVQKTAGVIFLVALFLFGTVESANQVRQWVQDSPAHERFNWQYFEKDFKPPDKVSAMIAGEPETMNERYYRTFVTKEFTYCQGLYGPPMWE